MSRECHSSGSTTASRQRCITADKWPTRAADLTRDHITPISRGGRDVWTNVVTACRRCNNHKGGRLPEEARLQLVAVPFTPTYAEYIYLKGRRVLADQMQYLLTHFPRSSPLHARLRDALAEVNRKAS